MALPNLFCPIIDVPIFRNDGISQDIDLLLAALEEAGSLGLCLGQRRSLLLGLSDVNHGARNGIAMSKVG